MKSKICKNTKKLKLSTLEKEGAYQFLPGSELRISVGGGGGRQPAPPEPFLDFFLEWFEWNKKATLSIMFQKFDVLISTSKLFS